jgi:hypothetical protein
LSLRRLFVFSPEAAFPRLVYLTNIYDLQLFAVSWYKCSCFSIDYLVVSHIPPENVAQFK